MKKVWREPTLDEILNDPTLDTLLARDGISKDELNRIIKGARETLARVPRSWLVGQEAFASALTEARQRIPPNVEPYLGGSLNTRFIAGLESSVPVLGRISLFGSVRLQFALRKAQGPEVADQTTRLEALGSPPGWFGSPMLALRPIPHERSARRDLAPAGPVGATAQAPSSAEP
jgi:hypothetical protein